ncbi:MAG: pentapeptide repeat-containing protein [Pseudomonadota bacterium]
MTENTSDKPELNDARQNPWYVLMTVAGEQPWFATWTDFDRELHAKNRRYFNGWMALHLQDSDKLRLVSNGWVNDNDFKKGGISAPLTQDELADIEAAWKHRCPKAPPPVTGSPRAEITKSELSRPLICEDLLFSGGADFTSTKFLSVASFRRAYFLGEVLFWNAVISEIADFHGASSDGFTVFDGVRMVDLATFTDATFSEEALFSNSKFDKSTRFHRTKFESEPPKLFGASLHEDTDFTDTIWPPIGNTREEAVQHRRAYERLKLLMDQQKKIADEHMFHRLEMRCKEVEVTEQFGSRWLRPIGWLISLPSRAFRWTSNYGWSMGRPALWLAGLWAAGWGALNYFEQEAGNPKITEWNAAALSLSNVFGFLGFWRRFLSDDVGTLTTASEIISASQTFLGIVFLFLLGLGTRNQFRLK